MSRWLVSILAVIVITVLAVGAVRLAGDAETHPTPCRRTEIR